MAPRRRSSDRKTTTTMALSSMAAATGEHDDEAVVVAASTTTADDGTTTKTFSSSPVSLLEEWISHDSIEFHRFTASEATEIRDRLLTWYDANRRKLPWRGDPPPWEGSTVNFGKKDSVAAKAKDAKTQRTMKQFFVAKKPQQRSAAATTATGVTKEDDCDDGTITTTTKKEEDKEKEREPTFPVSAYGVWVSEIMLQQTRVDAVVPYWVRWMKTFPTVDKLAIATEEEVNALWAGLGFYRRARLLHKAAKQVVDDNGGEMPNTVDGLLKLPGIGRYTACAIASIAYNVTVPVVDGNVCRVLARLKAIANHVKAPALKDVGAWDLAKDLVEATATAGGSSSSRAGDLNQALMELGATYCAPSGTGTDPKDPLIDFYYSTRLGRELAKARALGDTSYNIRSYRTGCSVCATNGTEEALLALTECLQQQVPKSSSSLTASDFASSCGHKAFPTAPPKTCKREEVLAVAALSCCHNSTNNNKNNAMMKKKNEELAWFLVRRPDDDGLLAGQWEFPSILVWTSSNDTEDSNNNKRKKKKDSNAANTIISVPVVAASKRKKAVDQLLDDLNNSNLEETQSSDSDDNNNPLLLLSKTKRTCLEEPIEHVFSHVRHTMWIEYATILMEAARNFHTADSTPEDDDEMRATVLDPTSTTGRVSRWMTESEMTKVGVTAGVKKIMHAVSKARANTNNNNTTTTTTTTLKKKESSSSKRQRKS